MGRAPVKYGLIALAALAAVVLLVPGALALRLASGPMAVPRFTPGIERLLAAQVEGGEAEVGEVEAVWFARENAVGLRLRDVRLRDGAGRPVLRADRVETAVALDSIALFAPAPARIVAEDFFVAL